MNNTLSISDFSETLFWDVDKTKIDFVKNANHVIEKAINNGTWEDFCKVIEYYGRERVKEVVKEIRYMDRKTLNFCSVYFNIPQTSIRCYRQQQSNHSHWNY